MTAHSFARALCLGILLLPAGCRRQTPAHPLPAPPLVSQAENGQFGGRFTLASAGSPKSFNPLLALDNASDNVVRLLFSPLLYFDQTSLQPGPGLAESWTVEPDQQTWTFKLRRGLRWSDGQPLTAADVEFTWNSIMYNPQFNPATFGLFQIGGKNFTVTNLDDLIVRVITPQPYAPFLEFFGGVPILPRHALVYAVKQKAFLGAYSLGSPPERIIGCGPFRLKEFRAGKFALLERNPEYWAANKLGRRLPYFDEVKIAFSGGPGSESELFLQGKSDACGIIRPQEYARYKQASGAGRFQVLDLGIGAERDFIWFNQNTGTNASGQPIVSPAKLKWFRNRKFRQAISCGIDRERLVREVYGGRAQPAYDFISTENPKWSNTNLPRYSFDPARARALFAEIGIQDRKGAGVMEDGEGNPLEILFVSNFGNPAREKAAAMIQEDMRKLGIKFTYQPVSFDVLRNKVDATFDYECALMGLGGGGVDPATQMNVLRSSEELHQWFPFQKSPSTPWEARIDALMDAQMRTLNFAERKKAFDEVQSILAEELPMIYLVAPFSYAATRSGIGNLRPSVLTPYRVTWNIEELFFKAQR